PQAEDLQEQLRQLKRQYLDTTQELMRRISALEEELAKEQEARKADAALARSEAAKETAATPPRASAQEFQGQLPSSPRYDLLREAETRIEGLELAAKAFEFHGYFRAGYGLNSVGGQQVAFQAPGAGAKYRLGNEAETYGEAIFVNNWLNPERSSDKAWLATPVLIQANPPNSP